MNILKKQICSLILCFSLMMSLFAVAVTAEDGALVISRENLTLFIGQSYVLTCSVYNNDNPQISYVSSDTLVATVSRTGTVRAVGTGTASIRAETDNGLTSVCTVKVNDGISPTEVILSDQSITVSSGNSHQLSAKVITDGTDTSISYFSSDTSIATVSSSGKVNALNPGIAVITAESASSAVSQKCIVKVTSEATASLGKKNVSGIIYDTEGTPQPNLVLSIYGKNQTYSSFTDSTGTFYIDNLPSDTYSVSVRKRSSTEPIATGTLSVVDSDIKATCIINDRTLVIMYKNTTISSNGITAIAIEQTALTMTQGDTKTLYYNTTPSSDAYKDSIVVTSDNESVVYVDENNTLNAIVEGTATITFSTPDDKISKKCVVTVVGITDSNEHSLLILICEVIPIIVVILLFAVKYKKFLKKRTEIELEREKQYK